ncbi:MAG TPA: anthranilate phosphoribosyltransferase [Gemmatimonadales bacterium]|nr:anthranilate phosphoribosyltransferase [Gemmatimonadales bacterium]
MTVTRTAVGRALQAVAAGQGLSTDLAAQAIGELMRGEASPVQTAALLMGLRARGETADELAGTVLAMRQAMVRVETEDSTVIDTCGTGGGVVTTFNVSTAAALVAVGAGARVAKHGNRSFTSRCGSADVLEALGVPLDLSAEAAARVLRSAGLTFLYAPAFHPAMRFAAPVRRELAVPTLFNIVGPLANPAGVRRQVIGVADRGRAEVLAETVRRLGADHVLVVHGAVGMDEISPAGITDVWEVRRHELKGWTIEPADFGMAHDDVGALAGGDAAANARRLERLLAVPGDDPAGRAAAILNGGAAVYVSGLAGTFKAGVALAAGALDSGAAATALTRFRKAAANTAA